MIEVGELHEADIYPSPLSKVPSYMPEIPRDAFLDAEFNFRSKKWKTSSQLYLQCLEMSCIIIANGGDEGLALSDSMRKIPLTQRINELHKSGKITEDMKVWAHQMRVIGQYDKHAYVRADENDAKELRSYCDLFMRYAFTMPGMLAERRARIKDSQQD